MAPAVGRERRVSFRALMLGRAGRSEMIGVFLALLELIRQKRVLIEPVEGDVQIIDAPEELLEFDCDERDVDVSTPAKLYSIFQGSLVVRPHFVPADRSLAEAKRPAISSASGGTPAPAYGSR